MCAKMHDRLSPMHHGHCTYYLNSRIGTFIEREHYLKKYANSTSKCDTRLCRLTVLFEYLDRLPESETFPRS